MDASWDGTRLVQTIKPEANLLRQRLADAAKAGDWDSVFAIVDKDNSLVNTTRPGGTSLYAILHQAAHNGAPARVVERLVASGAWRTLRNAQGERPCDVARRLRQRQLLDALAPVTMVGVPSETLNRLQHQFHALIRSRVDDLVKNHRLRLPELEPLTELDPPKMWFAVPGMYGGFRYWLERAGPGAILVAESWCRVSEGSGQRHQIHPLGYELLDEGFV